MHQTVKIPRKFEPFFCRGKYRWKIARGGRGGAKSWQFARILLYLAARERLLVLCTREFQNSIDDSVHAVLESQINMLPGMRDIYEVKKSEIVGTNGSQFIFKGLARMINSIKSVEGADICWIEEGQATSAKSIEILEPTIRRPGSEIWVSYNPEMDDDPIHVLAENPPPRSLVVDVNYPDNPFFPDVLRESMEHMKATNYDKYLHVWMGKTVQVLDGAVYANELRQVHEEERVRHVPYDPAHPVFLAFDLGWSDSTSIWVCQRIAGEARLIRYIEGRARPIADYIAEIQSYGYVVDTAFLPHDAEQQTLAGDGKTMKSRVEALGLHVQIVPKLSVAEGIEAARSFLPYCVFDKKHAADGFRMLSRYQYDFNDDRNVFSKTPLHNFASHGADAFRYLAVMADQQTPAAKPAPIEYPDYYLA